jgi:hypothetical protein
VASWGEQQEVKIMSKDGIFILSPPANKTLDELVEPNISHAPLCSV